MKRALLLLLFGCIGTTGGSIVDFPAVARAVPEAKDFTNDRGWHITLSKARLHIGAVYLDAALPVSGAQSSECILPGTYVAEITNGLDVDLLSANAQPFPDLGHGTTTAALAAQVWLTSGDVDVVDDSTPMLEIEGVADRAGDVRPFAGTITIGKNRVIGTTATPGANPICKQRIVSPIPTAVGVGQSGTLRLTIDARLLFANVDLADLQKQGTTYVFSDAPGSDTYTQPSINLWQNLHSAGLYTFSWEP